MTPETVTVAGTTLFHLAARFYGDASAWTRIAAANGLTDPWVNAITTLRLPRPEGEA